jgi:hypothetical protein
MTTSTHPGATHVPPALDMARDIGQVLAAAVRAANEWDEDFERMGGEGYRYQNTLDAALKVALALYGCSYQQ